MAFKSEVFYFPVFIFLKEVHLFFFFLKSVYLVLLRVLFLNMYLVTAFLELHGAKLHVVEFDVCLRFADLQQFES